MGAMLALLLWAADGESFCLDSPDVGEYQWDAIMSDEDRAMFRSHITQGRFDAAYTQVTGLGRFKNPEGRTLCDENLPAHVLLLRLSNSAHYHLMFDESASLIEAVLERMDLDPRQRAEVLLLRVDSQGYEDGEASLREAIALAPDDGRFYARLARHISGFLAAEGIFTRLHRARESMDLIRRALDLSPNDIEVIEAAIQQYGMPSAYGGDGRRSLQLARRALKLDPARGHYLMGFVYLGQLDRLKEAERHLLIAADLGAGRLGLRIGTALQLINVYLASDHPELAMQALEDLRESHPDFWLLDYQVGKIAGTSGHYLEEGKTHLQRWLANPMTQYGRAIAADFIAYGHYRLGQIHDALDEIDQARREYRLAMELYPSCCVFEDARLALLRLP